MSPTEVSGRGRNIEPRLYGDGPMSLEVMNHLVSHRRRNRSIGAVAIACSILVAACNFDGGPNSDPGFGSPEQAAEAFTSGELPDVEPWNPKDGDCRALLVGDSLTEAIVKAQVEAFSYMGCESIVDGLTARTLSEGWQCLANGGTSMAIELRAAPVPGNPTCRPSGLELLNSWSDFTGSASVTVIALGTNDAGNFTQDGWARRWRRAAQLTKGPLVFVTAAARPGDRWVEKVEKYNAALREWCPSEPRCTIAEWDTTEPANDPSSYVDNVHLTRAAGEMRAIFIAVAARQVAIPAPPGPSRWRAPTISLPPAPSTTVSRSTIVRSPSSSYVATPTSIATSSSTSTSSTSTPSQTTTSLPPASPPSAPSSDPLITTTTLVQ